MRKVNIIKASDTLIIMVVTMVFIGSYVAACLEWYIVSGTLFIVTAIGLYYYYYKQTAHFINCRSIYLVCWLSAIGLSALKIHPLQTEWKMEMWISLWLSILLFVVGYRVGYHIKKRKYIVTRLSLSSYQTILVISLVIYMVFFVEIVAYGGIPVLMSGMSAYKDFGISILHYITVSCVVIPPLTIYHLVKIPTSRFRRRVLLINSTVMLLIPILIVSRGLLLTAFILLMITYFETKGIKRIKLKYVVAFATLIFGTWYIVSTFRNQSDAYIKNVFQLDNKMSVPLYQLYIYIAFNIDNLNSIMGNVTGYGLGTYSLTPLLTFTGTKNFLVSVTNVVLPNRVLSTYTTYTFMLEPYKDLRVLGVCIYTFFMAVFSGTVERKVNIERTAKNIIFFALTNNALVFSFFTSYLSNTSMWGYFIIIFVYDCLTNNETLRCRR